MINLQLNIPEIPEARLWVAVIYQAINDITYGLNSEGKRKKKRPSREAIYHADLARGWIFGRETTFNHICDMITVEPEKVREIALKLIAEAQPYLPEELREGFVKKTPGKKLPWTDHRITKTLNSMRGSNG